MTDIELAEYLHLSPADAAIVISKLSLQQRAAYETLRQVEIDIFRWQQGIGPKPTGVLLDFDRPRKPRRGNSSRPSV